MRLRRDLRGFAAAGAGFASILLLMVVVTAGRRAWVAAAVFAVFMCWAFSGAVLLEDDRLRVRKLINSKEVSRGRVLRAVPGRVVWARGYMAPGVLLSLLGDQQAELPLSAFLGTRRQKEWIEAVTSWAENYHSPRGLCGERLTLLLSARQACRAQDLLERHPGPGILVAAVESPHDDNEYGPVFAEVRLGGETIRVHRRRPLVWVDTDPSALALTVGGHPDLPHEQLELPSDSHRVLVMILVDFRGRLVRAETVALEGPSIPASLRVRRGRSHPTPAIGD